MSEIQLEPGLTIDWSRFGGDAALLEGAVYTVSQEGQDPAQVVVLRLADQSPSNIEAQDGHTGMVLVAGEPEGTLVTPDVVTYMLFGPAFIDETPNESLDEIAARYITRIDSPEAAAARQEWLDEQQAAAEFDN